MPRKRACAYQLAERRMDKEAGKLAIVARAVNVRTQTFVLRHMKHLFSGRTVIVSTKNFKEPVFGKPTFTYKRSRIDQLARRLGIPLPGRLQDALLGPADGYREFFDQQGVNAVLCEFGYVAAEIGPQLLKTGRPVFTMFRGSDASSKLNDAGYRRRMAEMLPKLGGVIAVSSHLLDNLHRHGLSHPRSIVVPSGVDTQRFLPGKPEPGLCVCVGRLVPKKAPDKLLRAFAAVAENHDLKLEFVGYGSALRSLQRLAVELNVADRVTFSGYLPHDEIIGRLQRASMYIQHFQTAASGNTEGMPNVIQEAMSCGLPIVTTNHAGIPDHIRSGENGLLVEEGDLAGFSDALDKLAADARLRKRLGTAARAYAVENIDYRICHARIEAFMEQG